MHKVMDGSDVVCTVRAVDEGGDHAGFVLRALEHCEGDADSPYLEPEEIEWMPTIPALNHKQWVALCLWICAPGGPGSPHTDSDEE